MKIINYDFKKKRRFKPEIRAAIRKAFIALNHDDRKHQWPPKPDCLSKNGIKDYIEFALKNQHPQMSEEYRRVSAHLENCERCDSLFFKLAKEMAQESQE